MTEAGGLLDSEEVDFLRSTGSGSTANAGGPDSVPNQEVTMRGDLEQINLADEPICCEARERMIAEMDAWWSRAIAEIDAGSASEVEIDSTVVQRLRELGYVE